MHRKSTDRLPLTDEQRQFAEEHHGIVFSYLIKFRLPQDEWYDIVAIAYLYAIQDHNFDSNYSFSTYAYRYMSMAVINERRKQRNRNRIAPLYSLDTAINDQQPLCGKIFSDSVSMEQRVVSKISVEHWILQLTAKQREALQVRMAGVPFYVAAKAMGISAHALDCRIANLRKIYGTEANLLSEL